MKRCDASAMPDEHYGASLAWLVAASFQYSGLEWCGSEADRANWRALARVFSGSLALTNERLNIWPLAEYSMRS